MNFGELPIFMRLALAKHIWRKQDRKFRGIQSRYRIIYEDPANHDAPIRVVVPDPNWMACAIHGGVLPSIEYYHHPNVASHKPIGPMTEREAIDYLIKKDVPAHVRNQRGNHDYIRVIEVAKIPSSRLARSTWKIEDFTETA